MGGFLTTTTPTTSTISAAHENLATRTNVYQKTANKQKRTHTGENANPFKTFNIIKDRSETRCSDNKFRYGRDKVQAIAVLQTTISINCCSSVVPQTKSPVGCSPFSQRFPLYFKYILRHGKRRLALEYSQFPTNLIENTLSSKTSTPRQYRHSQDNHCYYRKTTQYYKSAKKYTLSSLSQQIAKTNRTKLSVNKKIRLHS